PFDAFARDLRNHTTILASRASNGAAASGGSSGVSLTSISDDGRFVAFDSDDTNLHPDDADTISDVFVRDMQENTTTLASRASGAGGAKGNSDSDFPSLSGDGSHVAFESSADNLHPDDNDTDFDVFLRALDAPPDTPLDTTITAGPEGATSENQPTFEFESNEPDSTFECRLDSTDEAHFDPCRSPLKTGRLAEGEHTFEVRAIDPSGNADQSPASRAFTVDTVEDPDPNPRGCTITGTEGDDVLRGTPGRDVICGLGGNDTIRGLGGNDVIYGDAGNDRIFGQGGNDRLKAKDGVRGNDLANGGSGRDRCAADPRDRRVSCP
ncbi:MAG: calcium-binding protein, partial [Rubrobacteraceae bacterium]